MRPQKEEKLTNMSDYLPEKIEHLDWVRVKSKVARLTKGIDYISFIKDYREGKSYEKIAISQGCSIATIGNRVRSLGLKRNRKNRELFSTEDRFIFSMMLETRGGRKQLLEILRGD